MFTCTNVAHKSTRGSCGKVFLSGLNKYLVEVILIWLWPRFLNKSFLIAFRPLRQGRLQGGGGTFAPPLRFWGKKCSQFDKSYVPLFQDIWRNYDINWIIFLRNYTYIVPILHSNVHLLINQNCNVDPYWHKYNFHSNFFLFLIHEWMTFFAHMFNFLFLT